MRMIDYDSVMKALEEEYQWQDHEKVAHEMLNVVKYFPTVETPHWIPCSDKLPVEGNNVLLSDDLNVTIGRLIHYADTGYKWEVDHWDCDLEVWQAWMPLPEPARLEGE